MEQFLGQSLAVLTAACFAIVSSIWSYAGKKIGSSCVTHIRLWLSLPPIILVHFIFTGSFFPHHLDPYILMLFSFSGLLGFTIADLFIFRSLILLGVRETLVILTLSPIFGTIISWFALSEKLNHLQILGILITIGGVMWVIYEEGQNRSGTKKKQNLGIPFAMAGALAQALANILSKGALMYNVHPISGTYIRIIAGLLGLVAFSLIRKSFIADLKNMRFIKLTAILAAGAVIGPIFGVIVSMYALTLAPVGIVTALIQVSPILLLPFDFFVLKKKITWKVVAGTVIAISGAGILFIY